MSTPQLNTIEPVHHEAELAIQTIIDTATKIGSIAPFDSEESVNEVVPVVHELYRVIAQTTFDPEEEKRILTDPRITSTLPTLRQLFSDVECAYEESWAKRISASQNPNDAQQTLLSYPMLHVYDFLISLEWNAARTVLHELPSKIAMVGSGPLPLTPMRIIELARNEGHLISQFHLIERYADRVQCSLDVLGRLGGFENITHEVADAANPGDLSDFDAVYVAILVGETEQQKEELLLGIVDRMKKGAVVITRGSRGLKGLVYPEIDVLSLRLKEKLHPVLKVDSYGKPGVALTASVIISKVL